MGGNPPFKEPHPYRHQGPRRARPREFGHPSWGSTLSLEIVISIEESLDSLIHNLYMYIYTYIDIQYIIYINIYVYLETYKYYTNIHDYIYICLELLKQVQRHQHVHAARTGEQREGDWGNTGWIFQWMPTRNHSKANKMQFVSHASQMCDIRKVKRTNHHKVVLVLVLVLLVLVVFVVVVVVASNFIPGKLEIAMDLQHGELLTNTRWIYQHVPWPPWW